MLLYVSTQPGARVSHHSTRRGLQTSFVTSFPSLFSAAGAGRPAAASRDEKVLTLARMRPEAPFVVMWNTAPVMLILHSISSRYNAMLGPNNSFTDH